MRKLMSILALAAVVVAGCSGAQEQTLPDSEPAELAYLPAPTGEVVLTILGADKPNVGDEFRLDLDGIESLGTETVTIHEPFLNTEIEMTGVLVDDLLAAAGVDPDAELAWTALDDYQVHFTGRQVGAENGILATRIDGVPIEIADGGPIRVIFTDLDGTLARDTNQWIWSLHLIEVG